jgi:ribosomal protein S18 acetylase RimI-like enzyme
MNPDIGYAQNCSNALDIEHHLQVCDSHFLPPLSTRVDIAAYAGKLAGHAVRYEAWSGNTLAGLVAVYRNDNGIAFITNVSVLPAWHGHGLARRLLERCIQEMTHLGMKHIDLEVSCGNIAAINLYQKLGFMTRTAHGDAVHMRLAISKDPKHEH